MVSAIFALLLGVGTVDTVETISFNGEVPVEQLEQWDFVEVVTYGDDEEEILGKDVGGVARIGEVYHFLDIQEGAVVRLTADGSFDDPIPVQGPGPGECREPKNLILWPDQLHIGIFNPFPLKLVNNIGTCTTWSKHCCPASFELELPPSMGRHILYNMDAKVFVTNLLSHKVESLEPYVADSWYRMTLFDNNGKKIGEDAIFEEDRAFKKEGGAKFPLWWALSAQRSFSRNSLFFIPGTNYTINEYSLEGNLTRVLVQEKYPGREITDVEAEYYGIDNYGKDNDYAPDLHSLFWVGKQLLVLTSRGLVGLDLTFDSFTFGDEVRMNRIVLPGVRPSPTARYYWLDIDSLVIVYGAIQSLTGDPEEHLVVIYERTRS